MQRLRVGDEKAALELHGLYAEQLQRIVRVRLTQPALRRQMDSIDICQSVFADFFVRAAMGQYDPQSPAELLRLLAAMARHRLIYHAKKQKAARRDMRRTEGGAIEDLALAGAGGRPAKSFRPESCCSSVTSGSTQRNVPSWKCAGPDGAGMKSAWRLESRPKRSANNSGGR